MRPVRTAVSFVLPTRLCVTLRERERERERERDREREIKREKKNIVIMQRERGRETDREIFLTRFPCSPPS